MTNPADVFGGMWRQHPLCPAYWFSSDGRAASSLSESFRLLKGTRCGQNRYKGIDMRDSNGRRVRAYLHVAICTLFNGPSPAQGLQCRHLDTDKENNRATNLAWGTPFENSEDSRAHGKTLVREKNPMAKLTWESVREMRAIRERSGEPFHSIAKKYDVSTMTAYRAITGEHWK